MNTPGRTAIQGPGKGEDRRVAALRREFLLLKLENCARLPPAFRTAAFSTRPMRVSIRESGRGRLSAKLSPRRACARSAFARWRELKLQNSCKVIAGSLEILCTVASL